MCGSALMCRIDMNAPDGGRHSTGEKMETKCEMLTSFAAALTCKHRKRCTTDRTISRRSGVYPITSLPTSAKLPGSAKRHTSVRVSARPALQHPAQQYSRDNAKNSSKSNNEVGISRSTSNSSPATMWLSSHSARHAWLPSSHRRSSSRTSVMLAVTLNTPGVYSAAVAQVTGSQTNAHRTGMRRQFGLRQRHDLCRKHLQTNGTRVHDGSSGVLSRPRCLCQLVLGLQRGQFRRM